jgi:hypothetical protein
MNEAERRREFELDILARVEDLEQKSAGGAIARNAQSMKETIEHWNKQWEIIDKRLQSNDNNVANFLKIVKDIQDNNTLALAQLRGHGPTA